jgi:hypothetical protein
MPDLRESPAIARTVRLCPTYRDRAVRDGRPRAAIAAIAVVTVALAPLHAQSPVTVKELAGYRLTTAVFQRFVPASRGIAAAVSADPRLAADPPFTREVAVSGDAAEVAPALEARLTREPSLAAALHAAKISPHDYATFAIVLIGARLAHGFVKSGAMRFVPAGVASDNVAFIDAHEPAVAEVLRILGVE